LARGGQAEEPSRRASVAEGLLPETEWRALLPALPPSPRSDLTGLQETGQIALRQLQTERLTKAILVQLTKSWTPRSVAFAAAREDRGELTSEATARAEILRRPEGAVPAREAEIDSCRYHN